MHLVKKFVLAITAVFIMPALATAGWWSMQDRPGSWSRADWSSSGILPAVPAGDDASIYILAARTGGFKGAFALHSWLVIRKPDSPTYDRYEKVGWGMPIRHNAYAADARWYSNEPEIIATISGEEAERLIPAVEAAISDYPYSTRGDYRIWPGPNSNSFVAHVLRSVPELGVTLPPNATGRDYAPGVLSIDIAPDWRDIHVTFGGLLGFAAGVRSGVEVHFAGLVAGFDITRPAIKVPAYGNVSLF